MPDGRTTWRQRSLLAAIVLGALVALWRTWPTAPFPVGSPEGMGDSRVVGGPAEPGDAPPAADPERNVEPGPDPLLERFAVMGRVLDAVTGEPLDARVRGGSSRAYCNPRTGRFRLHLDRTVPDLKVERRGYRGALVPIGEAAPLVDLGDIRLEPAGALTVLVVDRDGPVPGATVFAAGHGSDGIDRARPAQRSLGVTDREGTLRVSFAGQETLFAVAGDATSDRVATDPVDQDSGDTVVTLELRRGARIRVVREGSTEPEAGALLRLERLGGDRAEFLERHLDEGGWFPAPLCPGLYRAVLLNPRRELAGDPMPRGRRLDVFTVRADETILLEAPRLAPDDERLLRVFDARTSEPLPSVDVWLWAFLELPDGTAGWNGLAPLRSRIGADADGVFRLGWLVTGSPGDAALPGREQLCVFARGYEVAIIADPARTLVPGEPHAVPMTRAPKRRIRLVDGAGHPASIERPIQVWAFAGPRDRGILLDTCIVRHGRIGPILWPGGSLSVAVEGGPEIGSISEEVLRANPEVQLVVGSLGSIEVSAPDPERSPRLECAMFRGQPVEGCMRDGRWVFGELPAGNYFVGPPRLLRKAIDVPRSEPGPEEAEAYGVRRVTVTPPATAAVEWNPLWNTPDGPIVCRVDAQGVALTELFVRPVFVPDAPQAFGGEYGKGYPVGADGICVLADLDVAPSALVVCRRGDAGQAIPLAVCDDDRVARVRCGDLRVVLPDRDPDEPVEVEWVFRHESPPLFARARVRGTSEATLLRAVPADLRSVAVKTAARSREVPVAPLVARQVDVIVDG